MPDHSLRVHARLAALARVARIRSRSRLERAVDLAPGLACAVWRISSRSARRTVGQDRPRGGAERGLTGLAGVERVHGPVGVLRSLDGARNGAHAFAAERARTAWRPSVLPLTALVALLRLRDAGALEGSGLASTHAARAHRCVPRAWRAFVLPHTIRARLRLGASAAESAAGARCGQTTPVPIAGGRRGAARVGQGALVDVVEVPEEGVAAAHREDGSASEHSANPQPVGRRRLTTNSRGA